ncbi:DUF4178 domain-containing protein [Sphingomicrobium arenosum]|uniref:DUF4178 domain-containing protein n=1 Tax=Sphingomicrobium arenosum TaxID=2233861 RepID=UPI00223FC6BD|nr:DUF4178 domain-containing protein [Sphingomicrobium arenosum]
MNDYQTIATPSVKAIDCPSCGGSLELRAAGFTTLIVCQYCGSALDVATSEIKLVAEKAQAGAALTLPLGTRGPLFDVEWAVIGYLELQEETGECDRWSEYLLFNPYHGYRWLVHQHAGWSFGTPLMAQPAAGNAYDFDHDGRRYRQCHKLAHARVDYVLGEFYWHVKRGDQTQNKAFVSGEHLLSCEVSSDEYEWLEERFVPSRDIAAAFGTDDSGQYPATSYSPLPHHPNPWGSLLSFAATVSAAVIAVAIILMILFSGSGQKLERTVRVPTAGESPEVTIGTFDITGRPRPFIIETHGVPGNNNWLDVEYVLTNMDSDAARIANQPVEYYFGSDYEGSWREDRTRGTLKLPAVAPGRYELEAIIYRPEDEYSEASQLNLRYRNAADPSATANRSITVRAGTGGTFFSNFILLLLALGAPLFWIFSKASKFETDRREDYDEFY